jgi:hypothetical protein
MLCIVELTSAKMGFGEYSTIVSKAMLLLAIRYIRSANQKKGITIFKVQLLSKYSYFKLTLDSKHKVLFVLNNKCNERNEKNLLFLH